MTNVNPNIVVSGRVSASTKGQASPFGEETCIMIRSQQRHAETYPIRTTDKPDGYYRQFAKKSRWQRD